MTQERMLDDKKAKVRKPDPVTKTPEKQRPTGPGSDASEVLHLQQRVGNQAVQRLLAQRSEDGAFELDDDTASRINQARGGGQSLDSTVQKQMSTGIGHDFSGVRVHTSPEADTLNQQLSAKAFTTGQDIFFRQGAYDPGSSSGRELIAHELTHVVQQSTGQVSSGDSMTVRPAGDVYEQEADAIAKQAANLSSATDPQTPAGGVQRQEVAPEEELEEEALQQKAIQRQTIPEEEEEEGTLQQKAIQRQEVAPEDEELTLQQKAIQRQAIPEEEEGTLQQKTIQRLEEIPEEEV